ncbi:MAG: cytochrome B [Thiobacillus sp. 65-29]|nr:MAG: cytochrome B [Thiobacillus sp. 65-29]
MNRKDTPERYGSLLIGIHWLMLLLFIAVYASIELHGIYPKGSEAREAMKTWHFMFGMLVFVLVWLRLVARLSGPAPAIRPEPPAWMQWAARLGHLALYALMIGMPLLGWLILSAAGKPIPFFGLELPALIGENKELSKQLKEVHETLGNAGYFLIGLHVVAAVYHHRILHDNTMTHMLPGRR